MSDLYTQHTLDNGLRIVIETMPDVRSAAVGFPVLAGPPTGGPPLADAELVEYGGHRPADQEVAIEDEDVDFRKIVTLHGTFRCGEFTFC